MNTLEFSTDVVDAGLGLLPSSYCDTRARVLLISTAHVESRHIHRRQISGPAVSFFQFEKIAILEVLTNAKTRNLAREMIARLHGIHPDALSDAALVNWVYNIFQEKRGDLLSVIFARLNYWRDKRALPLLGTTNSMRDFYSYYISVWRPGKHDYIRWPEAFHRACAVSGV